MPSPRRSQDVAAPPLYHHHRSLGEVAELERRAGDAEAHGKSLEGHLTAADETHKALQAEHAAAKREAADAAGKADKAAAALQNKHADGKNTSARYAM